jgi:hypothetical protein
MLNFRCPALIALLIATAACNKKAETATTGEKPKTQTAEQQTFASPADAGAALFDAAKSGDRAALVAIFGPGGQEVLLTGDPVKDRDDLQSFVDSYTKMHRWVPIKAGGQVLAFGADNQIFPVPAGQNPSGRWYFDTPAGKDEILARRIGRGELTAIAACTFAADAEHEYFKQPQDGVRQYAMQFSSDPGRHNGLYWAVSEGQPPSPLAGLGDLAKAIGYTGSGAKPQPFNGYYYRILTKQGDKAPGGAKDYVVNGKLTGGFAILAYPAEYRNTGIMSFIVGADAVVYQRDLGENTSEAASATAEYNPGDGWSRVAPSKSPTG